MLKEMKEKVIKKAYDVKDFVSENKLGIISYSITVIFLIAIGVITRKNNKKYVEIWSKAQKALEINDRNYDYGPYKIMRILEPITRESLGEVVCHENTCKAFLDLRNKA